MKRKIYFRADAGPHIGYGHFIRSLALADMLKSRFDCFFATQAPTSYQREEIAGVCRLVELPATPEKFLLFLEVLKGDEIVVLDNYFYEEEYKQQIRQKGCTLVCIDDLCQPDRFSDVIINYGVESKDLFAENTRARLCLGLDWVLLRAPFLQTEVYRRKGRDEAHWVVCFGGSDEADLTGQVCKILGDIPEVASVTAIVGDGYRFRDRLRKENKTTIASRLSASELANLFSSAAYAVLPSSTIALEALACGITVLSGCYVRNQENLYHLLESHRHIFPLGELNLSDQEAFVSLLYACIRQQYVSEPLITEGIAERYNRLFASLDSGKEEYLFLDYTQLTEGQHRLVWETRNREEIRKWMVHNEPFSLETHLSFVESLKESTDKKYWAVFSGKGEFIGSYSLTNMTGQSCERGLYLAPRCFGQGVATVLEKQADHYLREMHIKEVFAEVLKDNVNSIRYHLRQGYEQIREDEDFYYYVKHLD